MYFACTSELIPRCYDPCYSHLQLAELFLSGYYFLIIASPWWSRPRSDSAINTTYLFIWFLKRFPSLIVNTCYGHLHHDLLRHIGLHLVAPLYSLRRDWISDHWIQAARSYIRILKLRAVISRNWRKPIVPIE